MCKLVAVTLNYSYGSFIYDFACNNHYVLCFSVTQNKKLYHEYQDDKIM